MSDSKVCLGDREALPLMWGGHSLYCRKCFTGDHDGGDNKFARTVDGVYIPEAYADMSFMEEVLAKGPKVGQCCSKYQRKRHDRPWWYVDAIEVGDLILCPNAAVGIQRSPLETLGWKTEFFIEESVPVARQVDEGGTLMLEPLGDWVWVDIVSHTVEEYDDIVVGYRATAQLKRAKVLQVGTGIRNRHGDVIPFEVKPGDTVLVRHNVEPFSHDGNKYYLVKDPCSGYREPDIYAILE